MTMLELKRILRHVPTFILVIATALVVFYGACYAFYLNSRWNQTTVTGGPGVNVSEIAIITSNKERKDQAVPVKMLFFGDLMLDRGVKAVVAKKGGIGYLFEVLAGGNENFFNGFDIISANLEGAVTDGGSHYPPENLYDFAFDPLLIRDLRNYNFNFFTLANNHFADQGQAGIDQTRKHLDSLGIDYAGCQDGEVGDCSLKIVEKRGKKIGLAGYSLVYSEVNSAIVGEQISELAEKADFVIVNVHWGSEYTHFFSRAQQTFGRLLIDNGADLVIGHHPHVVQGMEIYKNRPIFYSLGNFIFDQYFSAETQEGLAVSVYVIDGRYDYYLHPLKSVATQPRLMKGEERESFFTKINKWSEGSVRLKEGYFFTKEPDR